MAASPMKSVIEQVRRAALFSDSAGLGDGELLGCFVETREQGAFAALVKRHGPMVWGVCRRLLSHHDAEDAFQATFLVLVRKAASVRPREMVGNWLYGVAHQTALQARRTAARRAAREVQVTVMPDAKAIPQDHWHDLQPLLDRELSRLPDIYRAVIVLCDLEGQTRKEVARQLAVPEGTVAGRLARARVLLAKRLTRSGVAFSGAALAAVLAEQTASASVPASVVDSTINAASLASTGTVVVTAAASGRVAELTEGVLKAMLMSKLKAAVAVALVLSFLAIGATVLSNRTAAARGGQPPADEKAGRSPQKKTEPAEKPDRKADKDNLQGTWRVVTMVTDGMPNVKENPDDEADAVFAGDTLALVAQPAGKKFREFNIKLDETKKPKAIDLTVTEGRGKGGVAQAIYELDGDNLKLCFPQDQEGARPTEFTSNVGSRQVLFTMRRQKPKKEAENEKEKEKEPLTAWGKEVGGIQAGLGYRAGQKRAYSHAETVELVVRVRNTGKERVKLQYLKKFFVEKPLIVTDAHGKQLSLESYSIPKEKRKPEELDLAPGTEVEIDTMRLQLRSKDFVDQFSPIGLDPIIRGTGTFRIQYGQLAPKNFDNIASKLATGALELEISPDPPPAPVPANDFPAAWGGGGGNDYEIRVDKSVRHEGKASGSIKSITATPTWYGALTQAFDGAKFQGKRLRMTAYIKSKGVENSCGMWMRMESYDGKGHVTISSDLGGKSIKGTNDWKQDEIVMDVPKEGVTLIYFGAVLVGKGQVWVDDFKFEVVGNDVKTTGRVGEPGKATGEPRKGIAQEPKNLDFEE
ncbi:MAG TPA: sigma-70 family RNA polymerase sigma factor [Gemmataceae bacterium]|nr:sigma-70 family RNA polymerase sigma factor [Gemmataceae bacterium]